MILLLGCSGTIALLSSLATLAQRSSRHGEPAHRPHPNRTFRDGHHGRSDSSVHAQKSLIRRRTAFNLFQSSSKYFLTPGRNFNIR
jgi:hypothetical protein